MFKCFCLILQKQMQQSNVLANQQDCVNIIKYKHETCSPFLFEV